MDKAPDAFRTISEAAEELDVPQHVLRFWETRFTQIKPMKRSGGRRYYRPEDVDLLRGIRHLLYGEGYTIRGVQRILREHGARAVQAIAQGHALPKGAAQTARGTHAQDAIDDDDVGHDAAAHDAADDVDIDTTYAPEPRSAGLRADQPLAREPVFVTPAASGHPASPAAAGAPTIAPQRRDPSPGLSAPLAMTPPKPAPAVTMPPVAMPQMTMPPISMPPMTAAPHGPSAATPAPAEPLAVNPGAVMMPPGGRLRRDDIRKLEATLHELTECRRLIDLGLKSA